jgi:hypothetical protein
MIDILDVMPNNPPACKQESCNWSRSRVLRQYIESRFTKAWYGNRPYTKRHPVDEGALSIVSDLLDEQVDVALFGSFQVSSYSADAYAVDEF